jgi:hypothetical protein
LVVFKIEGNKIDKNGISKLSKYDLGTPLEVAGNPTPILIFSGLAFSFLFLGKDGN